MTSRCSSQTQVSPSLYTATTPLHSMAARNLACGGASRTERRVGRKFDPFSLTFFSFLLAIQRDGAVQGLLPGQNHPTLPCRRHGAELHEGRRSVLLLLLCFSGSFFFCQQGSLPTKPQGSTTTWTMSGSPRGTTPSSKCWATFHSAATSRRTPSRSPGASSQKSSTSTPFACESRKPSPSLLLSDSPSLLP